MAGNNKQVSPPKTKELHFPISRVKTIMKSSPDVDVVGQDPLFLVTKVTELFIADLARMAYERSHCKQLEYKHLAEVIRSEDTLDFLREIMPCKITMRQYRELMARRQQRGSRSSSGSSEEDSSDEEEEEEEEEEENETETSTK